MLESFNSDKLEYQKLSPEEMKSRGILGRLAGVVADFKKPTRNGRLYSEKLWENTFNDPIMQEKIKNRCLFGELGHPEDRLEVDMEKVAICMAEQPKKGKDGKLYSVFDILDTPNGRILKTFCDYGCNIGISSRGDGEIETDINGNESVVPETYRCECWDAVLVPGVEAARLSYMKESLGSKTFKQAINEELDKATPEDKKVMEETLDNLNIEYTHESGIDKESELAVDDVKANMVKDLQESLLAKQKAESLVVELQEKLSVCYAKEAKYEEDIEKYKTTIRTLSESASKARALETKVKNLSEELEKSNSILESEKNKYSVIVEKQKTFANKQSHLMESISTKDKEISALKENLKSVSKDYEDKIETLNEDLAEIKKNLTIKTNEYTNKLANSNKLIEKYKDMARVSVNKYIDSQALRLGVDSNEIKNKLPENYSFNDIDAVCESLSNFNLTVSKLPFNLKKDNKVKVAVKESVEPVLPKSLYDDRIDDDLMRLADL